MNAQLALKKTWMCLDERGLRATLAMMLRRLVEMIKPVKSDMFDLARGTDTSGSAQLWQIDVGSENKIHGVGYGTRDEDRTLLLLKDIPRTATFVDLGCGKGRALIIAKENGFERVIGVEFVKEFADVAKRNVSKCRLNIEVIHGDATKFAFPDGPLVVYMYNPFNEVVMAQVVKSLREHTGELWIVYANPRHDLFSSWMKRLPLSLEQSKRMTDKEAAIWRRS